MFFIGTRKQKHIFFRQGESSCIYKSSYPKACGGALLDPVYNFDIIQKDFTILHLE